MSYRTALTVFLSLFSRICSRSIDKGDYRKSKPVSMLHEPFRLSIAFRIRHTESVTYFFIKTLSALLCYDNNGNSMKSSDTADNRDILSMKSVSTKLTEVGNQSINIIPTGRPRFVSRYQNTLIGTAARKFLFNLSCELILIRSKLASLPLLVKGN